MNEKIETLAILRVWDTGIGEFLNDEVDTMGIAVDPTSPSVVWLELSRRDGPSVRIRATRQLTIVLESALATARELAALEEPSATDHHAP